MAKALGLEENSPAIRVLRASHKCRFDGYEEHWFQSVPLSATARARLLNRRLARLAPTGLGHDDPDVVHYMLWIREGVQAMIANLRAERVFNDGLAGLTDDEIIDVVCAAFAPEGP